MSLSILIIDDEPHLPHQLARFLKKHNYDVSAVADGEAGLRELQKNNIDLVLLDLRLPKMGGLEVLQQVKADARLRIIPVVVLTSSHEEKDKMRSYDFGVNAYVVKPVNFHEFVNAVKELGVFWAVINEPPPGSVKK